MTEAELYRLFLDPAVTGRQRSFSEVNRVVTGLRTDPRWVFLDDDSTMARPIVETSVLMGHQQVTDLYLVNLAAGHEAVLGTFDASLLTWLTPADGRHVLLIPV